MTKAQLTIAHARALAPWGFLQPPMQGTIGIPVFAQGEVSVRVQPSAGPPGAWAAQGSREAADGAAFMLRRSRVVASLRASLHCPNPRRLYAARVGALLGAAAASRSLGEEPTRETLRLWTAELALGWSPDTGPGQLLGSWLLAVAPKPEAVWESPPEPLLASRAAAAVPGIVSAAPELAHIWKEAELLGALGLAFDPLYGHLAVIFPGGNAPILPGGLAEGTRGRVGLGFAWT